MLMKHYHKCKFKLCGYKIDNSVIPDPRLSMSIYSGQLGFSRYPCSCQLYLVVRTWVTLRETRSSRPCMDVSNFRLWWGTLDPYRDPIGFKACPSYYVAFIVDRVAPELRRIRPGSVRNTFVSTGVEIGLQEDMSALSMIFLAYCLRKKIPYECLVTKIPRK